MSFELYPQAVNPVYPDDAQLITARALDRTPMWANVEVANLVKGVVDTDFTVRSVGPAGTPQARAEGALQLASGIGAVEFEIIANCLPNNAGAFGLSWKFRFVGSTTQEYFLFISSTSISIETSLALLTTLVHNVAIGDKFRVELSNGFRLFINGILRHERISGFTGTIQPPVTYEAHVREFVAETPPRIPAPILEGDWQLRPVVTFATPTEGALTSAGPSISTQYFDGEKPGKYTLEARIEPGLDIWFENGPPGGASVSTVGGGLWGWQALNPFPSAAPGSGPNALSGPNAAGGPALTGRQAYILQGATETFQINPGDVLSFWVWLDGAQTPQEIMAHFKATDATGFEHRAFWGSDLISDGTLGTPSRRFMGPLPATGAWVRLEVPASLVDLEGRTLNGIRLEFYDSKGGFDQIAKIPRGLQRAESLITIPPLTIFGDLVRTFQPGAAARFQSNYDDAQTPDLDVWSILNGLGSITADGLFTAPSTPGTTIVRASGPSSQVADLRVNVPALITPNFDFAAPLEQIDFETNISPKPFFVSAGTMAEGPGNVTPGLPPGIQAKDILLLFVESANEAVATPTDWGIAADSPQGTGTGGGAAATRLSIFWLRVPDSGIVVAPEITDPGDHVIARIRAYRNCFSTGNPWDVTAGNTAASATAVSIPGDTTTTPNCLIVQAVAFQTDTATPQLSGIVNTDLTNLAEVDDVATTQGNGGGFAIIEGEKAAAGPFGATTATLANASVQGRITIALRPNVIAWSSVPGGINTTTGVWTLPNDLGRKVRVSVTNGLFTAQRDILLLAEFPINRMATPVQGSRRKKVLVSEAEDGTDVSVVKDKDGKARDFYPDVQIKLLTQTQLDSILAFWDEYHPSKRFLFKDGSRGGLRRVVKFDSDINWEGYAGRFNVAFRVKEVPPQ